jgi:hypothetical protein
LFALNRRVEIAAAQRSSRNSATEVESPARQAAELAAKEQSVPGDATEISYEDKKGRWHDELSRGNDQPETDVDG